MTHEELALTRLTSEFQNSEKVKGLLSAIVKPLDALKADYDAIKTERWIDTAIGKQLDGCGAIVLEPRSGRSDEEYRAAIKFRVFVNRSSGTPQDLIKALKYFIASDDVQYLESYPATAILFADGWIGDKYTRLDFSRASTATYIENGTLKYAAADEPRYQDGVLLIEEQRTNLLKYSEQFGNALWTKNNGTVTSNAEVAPDGATTADKLVEDSQNSAHWFEQSFGAGTAGDLVCGSVFLKAAGRNYARVRTGRVASESVVVDLINGSISAKGAAVGAATVTPVGMGFFRVSVSVTLQATHANQYLTVTPKINAGGADTYQGDGTSGIYIWGAQVEAGASATSYIPTTTAQATRAADVAIYELDSTIPNALKELQTQIQELSPAGISDVPVCVSYTAKPLRFSKAQNDPTFKVNGNFLLLNGKKFRVSATQAQDTEGPRLGGLALPCLKTNTKRLKINGKKFRLASPDSCVPIESGFHLTGVY